MTSPSTATDLQRLCQDRGTPQCLRAERHEGERRASAVLRSLRDKASLTGLAPRQLHVFDDPSRDDRGWVLSLAHLDVVPASALQTAMEARVTPVSEATGMVHGHDDILEFAVAQLRTDDRDAPDPHGLLPSPFTTAVLRGLHEAVLGERLVPDSSRRAMLPMLTATAEKRSAGPATRRRCIGGSASPFVASPDGADPAWRRGSPPQRAARLEGVQASGPGSTRRRAGCA
jgi:ADP-ribose pyrophosphatase YjhB (NUDIX family)